MALTPYPLHLLLLFALTTEALMVYVISSAITVNRFSNFLSPGGTAGVNNKAANTWYIDLQVIQAFTCIELSSMC